MKKCFSPILDVFPFMWLVLAKILDIWKFEAENSKMLRKLNLKFEWARIITMRSQPNHFEFFFVCFGVVVVFVVIVHVVRVVVVVLDVYFVVCIIICWSETAFDWSWVWMVGWVTFLKRLLKISKMEFLNPLEAEKWIQQAGAELCQAQSSLQLNLASYKLSSLQLKSSNQQ